MTIQGSFLDHKNKRQYSIIISRLGDVQTIYDIKDSSDDLPFTGNDCICWGADPIQLSVDYSDTFQHTIVKSATVNFVTNFDLSQIVMASNNRDISVSISVTDVDTQTTTSLFTGYVEPLCFSSPFAYNWNEISLTCNDVLSSAQYIKYPNLILTHLNEQATFTTIIENIATELGLTVDDTEFNDEILDAMDTTKISNHLWVGDSEDDWMDCYNVLEEIGKYWGVWFMVVGNTLKLIDWHNEERNEAINVTKTYFCDDSTNISNADAYTQIKLECDIEDADAIVEFGDDLLSPYTHYAMYMEELLAEGNGSNALQLFKKLLINDETGDNDSKHPSESYLYKNFCWVKKSNLWDFGANGYTQFLPDGTSPSTQQYILRWLRSNPGKGAFVSFGRTDKMSLKDNSPINSIDLQDGLIISVCGHDNDGHQSQMVSDFASAGDICSFTGTSKQFTPADSDTTNYLIISGKIFLNKMYAKTGLYMHYDYDDSKKSGADYDKVNGTLYTDYQNTYESIRSSAVDAPLIFDKYVINNAVPRIGSNDYGCYYTQRYYDGNAGIEALTSSPCLVGDLKQDKYEKTWQYEWSEVDGKGKKVDNTSKVPILRCQLKIGDKYCVERIDKAGGVGWGEFMWLTEEQIKGQEPINATEGTKQIKVDGEWWYDMTIGINPKIDDYIIGKEYDIQNTIWYYDDVDGKGTAIPIHFEDNLGGEVQFKIKSPVIQYWSKTDKKVKSFLFIHTGTNWSTNNLPILEQLESIILSDFKIELTSDKGHILNNTANNDLVYASNMNKLYVEDHEDDVMIATMLTSSEAGEWGTEMVISDSHVVNTDNSPFYGFPYETEEVDENDEPIIAYTKPEQLYVNDFYLEYCYPRQIVDTGLKIMDIDWIVNPDKYVFNYSFLDGDFVPIKYEVDLKYNKISFSMKDMTPYEIPEESEENQENNQD